MAHIQIKNYSKKFFLQYFKYLFTEMNYSSYAVRVNFYFYNLSV